MLIHRDGWKYSGKTPAFFSGQEGCGCCTPPPPPPPSIQTPYYYTPKSCACVSCKATQTVCRWKLEVSGTTNYQQGPTCPTGTNCSMCDGTFILDPVPTFAPGPNGGIIITNETCKFISPAFTATAPTSVIGDCYQCENMTMYYSLAYEGVGYPAISTQMTVYLSSRRPDGTVQTIAFWRTVTETCLQAATLDLVYYYSACCLNPATVTITPL